MSEALVAGAYLYRDDFSAANNFELYNNMRYEDAFTCQGVVRFRRKDEMIYSECLLEFDTSDDSSITPTLSPIYSSEVNSSCISSDFTTTVMSAEELVTDESKPRTYRMCKDTVAIINEYDYDKNGFVEKERQMNGLSIFKSNVNILCGDKDDNNAFCSFTGGTFHIIIGNNTDDKEKPIENVQIQGFKFSKASEANIVLNGGDVEQTGSSRYGSIVLVKNCHFTVRFVLSPL